MRYCRKYLFVMLFRCGVDGNVADKKVLADADNIDAFDIAARSSYRGRDRTKFAGLIVNSKPKRVA